MTTETIDLAELEQDIDLSDLWVLQQFFWLMTIILEPEAKSI
jgi:hypothetical protein